MTVVTETGSAGTVLWQGFVLLVKPQTIRANAALATLQHIPHLPLALGALLIGLVQFWGISDRRAHRAGTVAAAGWWALIAAALASAGPLNFGMFVYGFFAVALITLAIEPVEVADRDITAGFVALTPAQQAVVMALILQLQLSSERRPS